MIENLLIDLFEYHYNGISTEKKINLRNKIYESKRQIEYFCKNLDDNFSKYILLILEQKIYELIEYVEKLIDAKIKSVQDILEIKNSLKLTGNDIVKIFEKPFQKTKKFDISSVLIVLLITDILSENKINLTDEEYDQIVQAESFNEKDRFEKYIEECKSYFEKIENGETEEDIEVYYEEDKNNEEVNEIYDDNDNNNVVMMDEEKKDNIIINNEEITDSINKNNRLIEEKKDNFIVEDIIDKNNSSKSINSIFDENDKNKVNNLINNYAVDKNGKNIVENKTEKYSNIEDLVKYINGNDNKKKRKKKRKKKTKGIPKKDFEEEKEENIIEKDEVFENFKSNLINFTANLEKVKKIKPKISEAFLEKLKLIN